MACRGIFHCKLHGVVYSVNYVTCRGHMVVPGFCGQRQSIGGLAQPPYDAGAEPFGQQTGLFHHSEQRPNALAALQAQGD